MQVYALVDRDGTGKNVQVQHALNAEVDPNGVVWHNGSLYVAEASQITRFDNADDYVLAGKVCSIHVRVKRVCKCWKAVSCSHHC